MKKDNSSRKSALRNLIDNIPEIRRTTSIVPQAKSQDILAMIRARQSEEESSQGWKRGYEPEPFHQFTADVSRRELAEQPLYKAGWQQGHEAGRIEAEEHARLTIRALMKLYMDNDD
jgi:hypothetical protein